MILHVIGFFVRHYQRQSENDLFLVQNATTACVMPSFDFRDNFS